MADELLATNHFRVDLERRPPIFIHGILPRSGTNFLWDLLLLHPDCARAREPVNEDLFLDHAGPLLAFVHDVRGSWDPMWGGFPPGITDQLCAALGEGLVSFLWTDRTRRLVSKSPSVRHLPRFFDFFPWARLIILVRDGRSVVQSAIDTFGWDFDRGCRGWAEGAATIRRFQTTHAACAEHWRVVRYEDLVDDPEASLRALFGFLGLDATRYDFEAARRLPVRGSSALAREQGRVHWHTVPRDETFAPKERWRSWTAPQMERFAWLAGAELVAFGYEPSRRRFSTLGGAKHALLDGRWRTANAARLVLYGLRQRVALRSRMARTLKGLRARVASH